MSLVNEEYWYETDRKEQCFVIKHILFNPTNPGGLVRIIFKATYGPDGMFTYGAAKQFVRKLVKYFNSRRFQRMKPVY
jgi:hypothetical protein